MPIKRWTREDHERLIRGFQICANGATDEIDPNVPMKQRTRSWWLKEIAELEKALETIDLPIEYQVDEDGNLAN